MAEYDNSTRAVLTHGGDWRAALEEFSHWDRATAERLGVAGGFVGVREFARQVLAGVRDGEAA